LLGKRDWIPNTILKRARKVKGKRRHTQKRKTFHYPFTRGPYKKKALPKKGLKLLSLLVGVGFDGYWYIYFRHNGKNYEEGLGWSSKGWSEKKAAGVPLHTLAQLSGHETMSMVQGYSHLSPGTLSHDRHHCHLKKGKPTYVAVWEVKNREIRLIEVTYVGTHEKAPY
jgi:hypothetical protein